MTVRFHPGARLELREAVSFYEAERVGLGADFAAEVQGALDFVSRQPHSGAPAEAGTRRKLLRRFPYSVIYLFDRQTLVVVAVMHHRRRPGYWAARLGKR